MNVFWEEPIINVRYKVPVPTRSVITHAAVILEMNWRPMEETAEVRKREGDEGSKVGGEVEVIEKVMEEIWRI